MAVKMLAAGHSDFHLFSRRSKDNKRTEGRAEKIKKKKVNFLEISSACYLWQETRIALK